MGPFGNAAKLLLKLLGFYVALLVALFVFRAQYHLAVGRTMPVLLPLVVFGGDVDYVESRIEGDKLAIGVRLPTIPATRGRVGYTTLAVGTLGYPLVTFCAVMLVTAMPSRRRWFISLAIGIVAVHLFQTLVAITMVLHTVGRAYPAVPTWSPLTSFMSSATFFRHQNQLNTLLGQVVPLVIWFALAAPVLLKRLRSRG